MEPGQDPTQMPKSELRQRVYHDLTRGMSRVTRGQMKDRLDEEADRIVEQILSPEEEENDG